MKTLMTASAALAVAFSAGPVHQDQDKLAQGRKFVLEAGAHQIPDLIDRAARFLGRNYLFSQQELGAAPGQTIELQNRLELDEKGCEEITSQLLYSRGFVLTPVDPPRGVYEWIHASGPRRGEIANRSATLAPEEVMIRTALKKHVTTVLPLKHTSAPNAMNSLRPFFASGGQQTSGLTVGTAGNNRTLVLSGFTDSVAAAMRMIQDADQPGDPLPPTVDERLAKLEGRVQALEEKLKK